MTEGFCIRNVNAKDQINHIQLDLIAVYVKNGSLLIHLENKPMTITSGQVAVIYPYTLYRIEHAESAECYLITFPYTLTKELYCISPEKIPQGFSFSLLDETSKYIERLIEDENYKSDYKAKSLYYAIMNEFFNISEKNDKSNTSFLHKIVELIRSGSVEDMTIKEISMRLGVSRSFLISYLKNHTEINFKDLVNNVLVGKSVELLYDKNLSITEVAVKSGFGSLRSFNRVFISKIGCTPSNYRKKINV